MSVDIAAVGNAVYALIFYADMIVYAFVVYRAAEMARAFVSKTYRSRARWIVWVSLVLLLTDIEGHAPYVGNISILGVPLGFISILVVLLALMPFVDRTIMVALDMDFFHRNTLRWRQTRVFVYVMLYGIIAVTLVLLYLAFLPSPPAWVGPLTNSIQFDVVFIGMIGGSLVYSVATLAASARRTSDMIFRKHLRLLGLVFGFGTVAILNDFSAGNLILDGALGVIVPLLWYLAAMSLSPIGRVEKGIGLLSGSGGVAVPPSSPKAGLKD